MGKKDQKPDHSQIREVITTLGEIFSTDPKDFESGRALIFTVLVYYAQLMERKGLEKQIQVMEELKPFVAKIGWAYPGKWTGPEWVEGLFGKIKKSE